MNHQYEENWDHPDPRGYRRENRQEPRTPDYQESAYQYDDGNQHDSQPAPYEPGYYSTDRPEYHHSDAVQPEWPEKVWEVDEWQEVDERHDINLDEDHYYDDQHDAYAPAGHYTDDRVDPQIPGERSDVPDLGIRINYDDLRDVGVNPIARYTGKKFAKVAAAGLFFVVGVMLIMSIQPDVTAYDIVSMDTYEGQQRPEWTLDPEEVEGCDSLTACFKESLAKNTNNSLDTQPAVREIPARAVSDQLSEQSPEENPEQSLGQSSVRTAVITAVPASVPADRMRVSLQWSNIREEPGMSGRIITSIASGLEVQVVGKSGSWYQIVTSDDRAIQGYMHQSTLN